MIIRPSLLLAVLSLALPSLAQQADRIADQPESTPSIRLTGHVPRWANPAADAGPVPGDTPLHLTFVLARAGGLVAALGAERLELGPGDALRVDGARGALLRLRPAVPDEIVIAHVNAVR